MTGQKSFFWKWQIQIFTWLYIAIINLFTICLVWKWQVKKEIHHELKKLDKKIKKDEKKREEEQKKIKKEKKETKKAIKKILKEQVYCSK